MIFQRAFMKEVTLTALAVFVILLGIVVATQAVNILGRAVEGSVAVDAVVALSAFIILNLAPVVIILTTYISVLTVLTRYWRDSEMTIWLGCGLSLKQWLRPVLHFALPLAVITALITWWVTPWAQERSREYAQILQQKQQMSLVQEGVFQPLSGGKRVYFLEKFDRDKGIADHLFIREHNQNTGRDNIILAKHAALSSEGNLRVLTLEQGVRYSGTPGQADYNVVGFERVRIIADVTPTLNLDPNERKTQPITALLARNEAPMRAELMWRLSLPISVLVLAFLAIPLSYFNPRTGHVYNILFAVALFIVYEVGLTLLYNAVSTAKIGFWSGFLPMHTIMTALAWVMLRYRNQPAGPFARNLKNALTGGRP